MNKYKNEFLKRLYESILRIRLCEESLVGPILDGSIKCPVHLYTGEEAIAVGVCAALGKKDAIFGNHRSHGHYLAKGGGMKELIAEIYGTKFGCSGGKGGSMHISDPACGIFGTVPIVGGTISLALGSALASKIRKDKRVTVSFFGDGATGEGVLHESLNFAALKKLPMIFICENNFYSTHLHISECRPNIDIYKLGIPYGIRSFKCGGNDVLKVYEAAKEAVKFARRGRGPVFIEFITYRLRGHVGPDDNIQGYRTEIRPKNEIEKWRKKDPIRTFEKYLKKNNIIKDKDFLKIKERIEKEVETSHNFAKKSPKPDEKELTKHVFK